MTENNLQKKPYPLGVQRVSDGIRFSFVSKAAACGILLYDKAKGKELAKIPFTQDDRIGNVYCRTLRDFDGDFVSWLFYEEDALVPDERARAFLKKFPYGREISSKDLKAVFPEMDYDWGGDAFPRLPYHQVTAYCLHVRGFTKHASSNVKHRGTFAGLGEKIPYLKEIGITTVELQPAYEFTEFPLKEEQAGGILGKPPHLTQIEDKRLNYWGYKKGFYYAPKAAYAASENPVREFRDLVRAFHENGMELVMQFYFPEGVKPDEIREILHFWVLEYHVDGFHLMGEGISAETLAEDDLLADTKLWYYRFDTDRIYSRNQQPAYPQAGEYNDSWYYDMRRFLKGDGGMLDAVLYHMRHIPCKAGNIHYLTNYYGFTLADLVSYDHKHNEMNGEGNRDGNDYNCSWNCGEEGGTRRKKIRQLRRKQMRNAMCLILLSQSTPLIFMGDEFGNTQKGNNNPYCQDNAVAWLDWDQMKKNEDLLDFWKMLVRFRKEHPILHPERELRLMDYIACGYPDLSYHGQSAWRPETESNFRHIGIMLCGKYAKREDGKEDSFLYLAMNMDWVGHELALPRLPRGMSWKTAFSTEGEGDGWLQADRPVSVDEAAGEQGGAWGSGGLGEAENAGLLGKLAPRSITVYIGGR